MADAIVPADVDHPQVIALLDLHVRSAHENSPPDKAFVLDVSGLRDPSVTLWSAWDGDVLLGLGALRQIAEDHGEIKSMRTAPDALRRGVAAAMLDHLTAEARRRGFARLSLETGANDAFAPARALYERTGFTRCAPFADYPLSAFNLYYSKEL